MVSVGDVFTRLTVVERAGSDRRKNAVWRCVCECGNYVNAASFTLTRGTKKSCGCLRRETTSRRSFTGGQFVPGTYWARIQHQANVRNIPLSINLSDIEAQWVKQQGKCGLTGRSLIFHKWNTRTKTYEGGTASLDRVDNSRGYDVDNIMWLHKDVNMMKKEYPLTYFLQLCEEIVNLRKSATQ